MFVENWKCKQNKGFTYFSLNIHQIEKYVSGSNLEKWIPCKQYVVFGWITFSLSKTSNLVIITVVKFMLKEKVRIEGNMKKSNLYEHTKKFLT